MSFSQYIKEKWIIPLKNSIGSIIWVTGWIGGTLWLAPEVGLALKYSIGYLFVSAVIFLTYWDYRFWKLERRTLE